MQIRPAVLADAAALHAIYAEQVRSSWATFDLTVPALAPFEAWVGDVAPGHHVLVAVDDSAVVGYAKSGTFRPRAAYDTTVETSVYVTRPGQGLGTALYAQLLPLLEAGPCHLAVANIALPNEASIALHERCGFTHVGSLAEVGRKFDRWHDVALWQRRIG